MQFVNEEKTPWLQLVYGRRLVSLTAYVSLAAARL